jgi:DNA-binding CsgD family transcriptional regulator/catechol 2,3-dioxygenase-like lactoylglutathione lyase family enzyme
VRQYDAAMATKPRRGRPPHADVLTPAEWRVVHAVQHGFTNREIAHRRGISVDAVKYHVENALAKLGLENRRALRTWFRVPKHSALARKEEAVKASVEIGRIGQISRTVKDIGQAEAWYRDVLGLPHLYTFGTLAFFDCGGTRLFLSQRQEGAEPAESLLYFYVDDIEAARNRLTARGVEFTRAPHKIHTHADGTEEWMAFFEDPDGRPLALMSRVGGEPPAAP